MLEFLLWLCGINSISAALGHRYSGLGIPCWGSWSLGCNCSSDLIPGMGTSYAPGGQKRKGKNKKRILRFFFIFSPSIFSKATQQLSGWFSHQRRPGELRLYLWAWHPSGNCLSPLLRSRNHTFQIWGREGWSEGVSYKSVLTHSGTTVWPKVREGVYLWRARFIVNSRGGRQACV